MTRQTNENSPDDLSYFLDRLRNVLTVAQGRNRIDESVVRQEASPPNICPDEGALAGKEQRFGGGVFGDDFPAILGPSPEAPLALLSIRDFVLSCECSVRLANRVITDDLFANWTVRDALVRTAEFKAAALSVQGLGRTSVEELFALLQNPEAILSAPTDDIAASGDESMVNQARLQNLSADALQLPLSFVLAFSDCSTRLRNALASAGIGDLSLGDFIASPGCLLSRLRDCKGVGRLTVSEAQHKIDELIDRIISKDPVVLAFADECLGKNPTENSDVESSTATPIEWPKQGGSLEQILSEIPEREGHVLTRRYGLGGMAKHTLEEIASDVHVTRERIRQIEAKALRRLASPMYQQVMRRLIGRHKEEIWNSLSGGNALITDTELRENRHDIDPRFALAIDVAYGNVSDWLVSVATRTATGWLLSGESLHRLDEITALLDQFGSDHPLPTPFASAASALGLDLLSVDLASEHSTQLESFESYLCVGRVGAKTRRTIRLHSIALEEFGTRLFDIAALVAAYRSRHPDDVVAPRIFQMQLEDAPNLFCKLFDCLWFALAASASPTSSAFMPFERQIILEPTFEEGSIGQELAKHLIAGPKRQVDLRALVAQASKGQVAGSSVGAILSSNPCFRRVAPGIFDLCRSGDVYNENGVLTEVLLDDRQCRAYCLARFGGAPMDWYPSWGPSFELWLTRWASLRAESDLFRSLLFVGDPSTWPAPEDELRYWQRAKEHEAAWLIGTPRRFELGRRFIEPDQFICTLAQLSFFGWTSWTAVNRTTDARGDFSDAADILALLIKADLVSSPQDWQQVHRATESVQSIFIEACLEMHENGDLNWDEGVLKKVWSTIERNAMRTEAGWIENQEFAAALGAWQSGSARSSRAFSGQSADLVDPAPIFETDDWDRLFGGSE